jgi:hypothetical protein
MSSLGWVSGGDPLLILRVPRRSQRSRVPLLSPGERCSDQKEASHEAFVGNSTVRLPCGKIAYMAKHDPFEALARNAFDFLERAVKEFAADPKYSVIHFCAAIEMLLKARLMKEHWSLIVSRPEQAALARFEAGDFISVTLEESRLRLRDIAGEDIGDDAYGSFRALANHRNKMIHFFHADIDGDVKARERIVAEQCRSWFYLHGLLRRWDHFNDFNEEAARADRAMKKHRLYLRTKFNAFKPQLDAEIKAGRILKKCRVCGFMAAVTDALDDQIETLRCRVCDHAATEVELDCPHCGKSIVITSEGYATCGHCDKRVEPDDLVGAMTDPADMHRALAGGDDSAAPANCGLCEGHHTVIGRGGRYFCANCFDISEGIRQCQWCNEYGTDDMEHSYSFGCGQCDGKVGYEKDD